jgi:hypothetical protein
MTMWDWASREPLFALCIILSLIWAVERVIVACAKAAGQAAKALATDRERDDELRVLRSGREHKP